MSTKHGLTTDLVTMQRRRVPFWRPLGRQDGMGLP